MTVQKIVTQIFDEEEEKQKEDKSLFHAQDYKAHRLYVFIWRGTSPCKETEHTLSDVEANRARGITFQIKRNAFGIHWQNLPPALL